MGHISFDYSKASGFVADHEMEYMKKIAFNVVFVPQPHSQKSMPLRKKCAHGSVKTAICAMRI